MATVPLLLHSKPTVPIPPPTQHTLALTVQYTVSVGQHSTGVVVVPAGGPRAGSGNQIVQCSRRAMATKTKTKS